ncbi:haloacid dehalogenase [filamentous cyanobacterium CCP5]|nr:haloacid dehalogenase [filamentous cyanobacterium CCP5]
MAPTPGTLALDFDGVICDGLIEYFQTAWRAYCQLFEPDRTAPPAGLAERFYPLRPVVESGWEMPILIFALRSGYGDGDILRNWSQIAPELTADAELDRAQVAATVDGVRDRWIKADLDDWLSQHRFYPGVVERMAQAQESGTTLYIVSTKEGRFIRQLLSRAGLDLPRAQILGKEVKRPKYETLRLLKADQPQPLWFIEDRLQALVEASEQADLQDVALFLADWGYNVADDQHRAEKSDRLHLLTLDTFSKGSSEWFG